MRVGVLTGGGDCPGLNAVIRGVVRRGVTEYGYEFVGFRDGWKGPLEGLTMPLDIPAVRGILPRGGTILGSSRTNLVKIEGGIERTEENLKKLGIDALIAIGGEDTLGVATTLTEHGFHVIGVPKTIDNDLSGTDYTFGFDTAVSIATEAIDRLHTTAESHHRILICEVMGRHAGWIALHSGMAGGANVILIPEVNFDLDEVVGWVESRFKASYAPIIVVAEGAIPADGDLITKDAIARLVRPRQALRHRRVARAAGRGAHGPRGPHHGARPHPARRLADGLRPRARHPVRPERHHGGQGRGLGHHGRAAGHRHRPHPAPGGDRRAQDRADGALRGGQVLLRVSRP